MNLLLYTYMKTYLLDHVLVKADRACMAHGLEVRSPFLDHELVAFMNTVPYNFKYRRGTTKLLLKELMKKRLPPQIITRRKKGFGVPLARWLRGDLKVLCVDTLSGTFLKELGFINTQYVESILSEHLNGRRDHSRKIWTLIVFLLWYRRWIR